MGVGVEAMWGGFGVGGGGGRCHAVPVLPELAVQLCVL